MTTTRDAKAILAEMKKLIAELDAKLSEPASRLDQLLAMTADQRETHLIGEACATLGCQPDGIEFTYNEELGVHGEEYHFDLNMKFPNTLCVRYNTLAEEGKQFTIERIGGFDRVDQFDAVDMEAVNKAVEHVALIRENAELKEKLAKLTGTAAPIAPSS